MSSITFFFIFVTILAFIFLLVNFIFAPHNPLIRFGKSKIREKLSNSGELLKLWIPSHYGNIVCGWSNYLGMVTTPEVSERKMDNRGSKSIIIKKICFVKEQRVYGSWHNKCLRCTLVGFERNYQVRIHSNLINIIRYYSNVQSNLAAPRLNPWFITGFTDGEGSFMLTIIKDKKYKLGWRVACRFAISLNRIDFLLLNRIKNFFGVGNIIFMGKDKDSIQYRVESLKDLSIIINHFDKYPLITKKRADYVLFALAYKLIMSKSHVTQDGLLTLVSLKAALNRGLSEILTIAFPDITPVNRPEVQLSGKIDPFWFTGFVDAEGCFSVVLFKSKTSKFGEAIKLSFILTQSARDINLILRPRSKDPWVWTEGWEVLLNTLNVEM